MPEAPPREARAADQDGRQHHLEDERLRVHRAQPRLAIVADWTTASAVATAGGTLVLAAASFASVRSANRAARAAERSLLAALRPVLMPSRLEDPPQKVHFVDGKWLLAPG